ncbi:MAG: nucleotidyltransferase domain-containing protein [Nitrospirae bacterium]|nr:nucleotidyltransferase domain-containing protein [Candidatus Troglogloeales bacterium]MBI3598047.1 nucleotidyltransferase domain-containing protein [Candidatus Troglogloeales bacterium]
MDFGIVTPDFSNQCVIPRHDPIPGMIKKKFTDQLKNHFLSVLKSGAKIFLFGSCLDKTDHFADVDVGIVGKGIDDKKISLIRENMENSTFPYKIDIVNFNEVDDSFKDEIFSKKIKWLT